MIAFCSTTKKTYPIFWGYMMFTISLGCFLLSRDVAFAETPVNVRLNDNISKILRMPSAETLTIDGNIYKIPPSWQGKKLHTRVLTFEDFSRIPRNSTWQNSNLYLLKDAREALVVLLKKAEEDGISLIVHSAYRSKNYQKKIFTKMISEGRSFDDIIRYVAPPGYSEHMLGTVVDFYPSNWNFADLEAYTWLRKNGQGFGFSETYPEKRSKGEPWEPWHWRYIPEDTEQVQPENSVREITQNDQ